MLPTGYTQETGPHPLGPCSMPPALQVTGPFSQVTQERDPRDNGVSLRAGLKGAPCPQFSAVPGEKGDLSNDAVETRPRPCLSETHSLYRRGMCVCVGESVCVSVHLSV